MKNTFIYFPKKSHHGYYDRGLQQWFDSKQDKRVFMNEHKLVEDGSMENDRHRVSRITDQINVDREKKGLKPLTKEQVVGNSREISEFQMPKRLRR